MNLESILIVWLAVLCVSAKLLVIVSDVSKVSMNQALQEQTIAEIKNAKTDTENEIVETFAQEPLTTLPPESTIDQVLETSAADTSDSMGTESITDEEIERMIDPLEDSFSNYYNQEGDAHHHVHKHILNLDSYEDEVPERPPEGLGLENNRKAK